MIEFELEKRLHTAQGSMPLCVKMHIKKGEIVALCGKSGVGKTSILRMLAGLLAPDKGRIEMNSQILLHTAQHIHVPPRKRDIGMVFQDYALFPNMTILQNLQFALPKKADTTIIGELLHIMELDALQKQYPTKLSGGQQQRVALARALVQKPQLLLLDEPLSALDVQIRTKLQNYILEVHRAYDLTIIWVSHDIAEVEKMAHRTVVLDAGKVVSDRPIYKKMPSKQTIKGVVTTIHAEQCMLEVRLGTQLIQVPVEPLVLKQYQVGEEVSLYVSVQMKNKLYM